VQNIYIETLGCSKNQVDSEKMLFVLKEQGFTITKEPENADIIIINTCGFIKSAKEEAIQTILDLSEYKKTAKCRKLIVAGCLAQYYPGQLKEELPEIDVIFGIGNLKDILMAIKEENKIIISDFSKEEITGREILNYDGSAYLKISDGCSNFCSYCLIPKIRGGLRSRKIEDILAEVRVLKEKKINEINIISQDTANYGIDIYMEQQLPDLIKSIDKELNYKSWIRVLYMHPDHISENMLTELSKIEKFIPYFDIPFQSGSDRILKLMNRKGTKENYLKLLIQIKKTFNNPVIRSTFITGFPTENETDFAETLDFIEKAELDWVGGFTYSREDDTAASKMKGQIKNNIKNNRLKILLDKTDEISAGRLKRFIGEKHDILIEEKVEGEELYFGRIWCQAPEVDSLTLIKTNDAVPGTFISGEVKKLNNKDFFAVT